MPLNNTIILPADNTAQAKTNFDDALALDKVTIIIFGDTPKAETAVNNADGLSNGTHAGFQRQVIWIKNNNQWDDLKSSIFNGGITVDSIIPDQSISLSISLSRKAYFVIDTSKTPDNVAMNFAFVESSRA